MKEIQEIKKSHRLQIESQGQYGFSGIVIHPLIKNRMVFVASWNGGWEHVSVSFNHRCPTWDEMCIVKDIFWNKDECVIQFHPPEESYVDMHKYCLHLWKKEGEEFGLPELRMI